MSRSRRGKVGLLLARIEHHCCSCSSGCVLLHGAHSCSGARVLQVMLPCMVVVVVVMHVRRREVLQLVVVMGPYC